ncbi:MAG: hypothetical protein KGP01_02665 [Actinomycetales bacterium]|nr:hypothetical protein [Actinomycetales bacterium]
MSERTLAGFSPVVNESIPTLVVIVSDDDAAHRAHLSRPQPTQWPALQLVRSEQLLFGVADSATVLVRDAATVPASALVSVPGIDIRHARDASEAYEVGAQAVAHMHALNPGAETRARHDAGLAGPEPAAHSPASGGAAEHDASALLARTPSAAEGFPLTDPVEARADIPRAQTHPPGGDARRDLPVPTVRPAAARASNHDSSAPVVLVVNAVGGAGASTLAWAAAAFYESTRGAAAIVDADDRSPGLDIWTCDESTPAVRWPDLAAVTGAVDPQRLWQCLIHVTPGLRLLSHGRVPLSPPAATAAAVTDALAAHPVVIDCSSSRAGEAMTEVLRRADAVIVASTATVSGCAAARTRINSIRDDISPGVGVLAALRERHPGVSLSAAREALGVDVLAIPEDPRAGRSLRERSLRPFLSQRWAPLGQALERCTEAVATRPAPASSLRGLRNPAKSALRVVRGAKP